jgi:hypothetical protein
MKALEFLTHAPSSNASSMRYAFGRRRAIE